MKLFLSYLTRPDEEIDFDESPLVSIVIEVCEGRRLTFKKTMREKDNEVTVYADQTIEIKPIAGNALVLRVVKYGDEAA